MRLFPKPLPFLQPPRALSKSPTTARSRLLPTRVCLIHRCMRTFFPQRVLPVNPPITPRARIPLSTLATAPDQIDRPVGAALNLALDALETITGLCSSVLPFGNPRWRAAALVASAVSLSLGSALFAAAAAFFLPVALALSAAAAAVFAALAPPTLALGWVVACTGPACEQLWRPLLVRVVWDRDV